MSTRKIISLFISLLVLMALSLSYYFSYPNNSTHSLAKPVSNSKEVDFYRLYYAIKAKELANFDYDKQSVIQLFENVRLNNILSPADQLSQLSNIWFYMKVAELLKVTPKFETDIIRAVNQLQLHNGTYVLQANEVDDLNLEQNQYHSDLNRSLIISTMFATDIYKFFNQSIPQQEKLKKWITTTYDDSNIISESNLIGSAPYIYLLTTIEKNIDDHSKDAFNIGFTNNLLNQMKSQNNFSIEDLDILIKLSTNTSIQIELTDKQEVIKSSLYNKQLENGAFPFPGTKNPDVLSTYVGISVLCFFNIPILKKAQLDEYLDENLKECCT